MIIILIYDMILFELLYTNFWSFVCNSRLHPDGFRDYLILATPRPDVYMARAVSAGAVAEGDLVRGKLGMVGRVKDPIGFVWQISEHMLEPMLPGPFRSNKN